MDDEMDYQIDNEIDNETDNVILFQQWRDRSWERMR